jgi:two-component system sensor histidine kinase KdpD
MRDVAALTVTLLAITLLIVHTDLETAALFRHLYFVPVVAAALRLGAVGGGVTAAVAVLLEAPGIFAVIEQAGVTPLAAEYLVTFVALLVSGVLGGRLAGYGETQRRRFETLLAVQRVLAEEAPLDVALERLRVCLAARLDASAVALVVREDERLVVAGGGAVVAGSLAAEVLATGVPRFGPDTGRGSRPRRTFVAPLVVGAEPIGVLVVERRGELPVAERSALAALAAHCGLALENARLASRQRRFAEELAERIASATAAKSAFVALASHELRTPLTALLGFSELLAQRPFEAVEVRRMAELLQRETERLARIVDDFLDLSRLERGLGLRLAPAAIAVAPALAAAVELFRRADSHRIVLECDERLPAVLADPDALDRILKNLVSNAIKYSPAGSTVRITARAAAAASVEVSVHDDGRGIPPDALPRVFEPYYRAPGAAGAARGTGLGLAVVKALIEAHGGTIGLESAPGRGTRVTFVLPAVS